MKRFWLNLMLLAAASPAWAGGSEAPYYGPMKRWQGIGYKFGYQDRVEKDGSWRIDAAVHGRGDAIDMALYRAAELARAQGYRYVDLLGGRGSASPGFDSATVYARPNHEPGPPVGCPSKKVATCYTADVAEVLRILGGPGGTQPGVAIMDHRDEFGREVFLSGYGTGAVANRAARSNLTTITEKRSIPAAGTPVAPTVVPVRTAAVVTTIAPAGRVGTQQDPAALAARDRLDQALKDNAPIRGGDPKQGWTVSD